MTIPENCTKPGCGKPYYARGLCSNCYRIAKANGEDMPRFRRAKGTGNISKTTGYKYFWQGERLRGEHILIAEKALGHALPPGACVHHVDGNRMNNEHSNLVICPSDAYHKLLHLRQDAYAATGDPAKRHCSFCKKWDSPSAMYSYPKTARYAHHNCMAQYDRAARKRRAECRISL